MRHPSRHLYRCTEKRFRAATRYNASCCDLYIIWKEILRKYSIQSLKTADPVWLSVFMRDKLVPVSMPSYFERPTKIARNMHSLSFHQVHVSTGYFSYGCCFVEQAPRRFRILRRSWPLQERSEQDQLSRAIESNICFYPIFISFLLTLTLSSFFTLSRFHLSL